MFDFSRQTLFLTGANGAIGRAIARLFFGLRAACVLTDVDEAGVAALAQELDPSAERAIGLRQDVACAMDAREALAIARERFGAIDFVVAAAGVYPSGMVKDLTEDQWRQSIEVNLSGVFHTCRAAVPLLRDGGAVVNIASMAGHRGSAAHAHYAAAKGGVLAFSRSLAVELAPTIRVNAVSPGLIEGAMVQPLLQARGPELIAQTPLRRLGRPEEVAHAVAFLCSDWASFITGETIHVNGGLYVAS